MIYVPAAAGKNIRNTVYPKRPPLLFRRWFFEWRKLRQLKGTAIDQHLIPSRAV